MFSSGTKKPSESALKRLEVFKHKLEAETEASSSNSAPKSDSTESAPTISNESASTPVAEAPKEASNSDSKPADDNPPSPEQERNSPPTGAELLRKDLQIDEGLWIDYSELTLEESIATGSSSTVYRGEYRGSVVSVKVYDEARVNTTKLKTELEMLASVRSPSVVYLYGICVEPKICVVTEFCEPGSVFDILQLESEPLEWPRFFKLASGLASGVSSLHNWRPQIIHREIRPQNLLLTDEWKIKFSDFGTYKFDANVADIPTDIVSYVSPEVFERAEYSVKSDVYCIGVVIWELIQRVVEREHVTPFGDITKEKNLNGKDLGKEIVGGLRPKIDPKRFPEKLKNLVELCWDSTASKRPTIKNIIDQLRDSEKLYRSKSAEWKALIKSEDEKKDESDESDSDSDEPVKDEKEKAVDKETDREESLRKEIERQVAERLEEEKKRLKEQLDEEQKKKSQVDPAPGGKNLAEIDPKQLIEIKVLGKGQFGEVFKGTLWGSTVAIKRLKDLSDDALAGFKKEVSIMTTLRHPNICLLIGACTQPGHLRLVIEYMSNGSVERLIHPKGKKTFLSFEQRMKMAKDAALGMNFLHHMQPPVLHLDLKPDNLLVDSNFNVKVSDFGLSAITKDSGSTEAEGGSPFYMAPEVLLGREVGPEADVYSYGIMLWEIYTCDEPYKGQFEDETELEMGIVEDGIRPPIPPDCPPTLRQVMEDCWQPQAEDRTSFQKILENMMFEKMLIEHKMMDPEACTFWKHYFVSEHAPLWQEFWTCLVTFLKVGREKIPSEADPRLGLFKQILTQKNNNIPGNMLRRSSVAPGGDSSGTTITNPDTLVVTLENFNKFLLYFGPFDIDMIDRMAMTVNNSYFHGDLNLKKTEALLSSHKKKSGCYLVRYATRPGDFIVSVMRVQKKKFIFDHHTITRVPEGFAWLTVPRSLQSGDLKVTNEDDRKTLLNSKELPTASSIVDLIRKVKKEMGILKLNRFVPHGGVAPKVDMPELSQTKASAAGSTIFRNQALTTKPKDDHLHLHLPGTGTAQHALGALRGRSGTAEPGSARGEQKTARDSILSKYFGK